MLVCLALCTFILHCSANATQQFVSRLHSFLLGEENKGAGSHAASYTLFANLSVRCTCGSSICSNLPPIGGGVKQPYPLLSKSFHAAFVQRRCRLIRAREVPCGMQSSTEPPYTAELRKGRGERKGRVKIPGLIPHTQTVTVT